MSFIFSLQSNKHIHRFILHFAQTCTHDLFKKAAHFTKNITTLTQESLWSGGSQSRVPPCASETQQQEQQLKNEGGVTQ